ncbi:MAG: ABC transporter ATP-binding protein [Sporomusaceae bacterium]|nr:ABC transporter ATP-binding protein [Sporomusaceae bacterium]
MIRFEHFSYGYGPKNLALQDIAVELASGTLTVVTGLSGCGKSTFCRSLCGLVPHFFGGRAAGDIYLNETSIVKSTLQEISPQVAIVLEDYESQLFSLTVWEEMTFHNTLPLAAAKEKVETYLAAVGLAGFANREIAALSGGQKQRLAIAAALIREPQFFVFDEPAAALDPEGKKQLYKLLRRLSDDGMTVVAAEQDPRDLLLLADQLLVLEAGKLRFAGTPRSLAPTLETDSLYQRFLPDLWQLRSRIGDASLPYWQTEEEASKDLFCYLQAVKGEKRC